MAICNCSILTASKKITWKGDRKDGGRRHTSQLLDQLGPEGRVGENACWPCRDFCPPRRWCSRGSHTNRFPAFLKIAINSSGVLNLWDSCDSLFLFCKVYSKAWICGMSCKVMTSLALLVPEFMGGGLCSEQCMYSVNWCRACSQQCTVYSYHSVYFRYTS